MRAGRLLNQSRRSQRSTSSVTTTAASRSISRTYTALSRQHSSSHSCPRTCPLCSSSARSILPSSSSSRLSIATSNHPAGILSSYTPSLLLSSSFHSSSHPFEAAQPAAATTSSTPPPNIPASHAALFAQGLLPSPTAITTPTQRVRDLFTELTQLSQFEMAQLHNLLNKSYGVPTSSRTNFGLGQGGGMAGAPQPAAGGAVAAAAGGAKGEEKKEEKAAEVKTAFSVRLDGFNAADKIKVIKEVRTATGLGLKESKELVEGAPKTIKKDLNKADCDALVAKLKEAGAKVTVE